MPNESRPTWSARTICSIRSFMRSAGATARLSCVNAAAKLSMPSSMDEVPLPRRARGFPARVETVRARAQVCHEERAAEQAQVLHEHGELDLRHHRILHRPERMQAERDRDEEGDEHRRANPGAPAEQYAQTAEKRQHPRGGNEEFGERNASRLRVGDGGRIEMGAASHQE